MWDNVFLLSHNQYCSSSHHRCSNSGVLQATCALCSGMYVCTLDMLYKKKALLRVSTRDIDL